MLILFSLINNKQQYIDILVLLLLLLFWEPVSAHGIDWSTWDWWFNFSMEQWTTLLLSVKRHHTALLTYPGSHKIPGGPSKSLNYTPQRCRNSSHCSSWFPRRGNPRMRNQRSRLPPGPSGCNRCRACLKLRQGSGSVGSSGPLRW